RDPRRARGDADQDDPALRQLAAVQVHSAPSPRGRTPVSTHGHIACHPAATEGRRLPDSPWITGTCWLYCRRSNVTVTWIGPVVSSGAQAPLYGCAMCIA